MAGNLIHDLSTQVLKRKLEELVAANDQPLEPSAKRFLAVANLQGFDLPPDSVTPAEMDLLVASGHTELNRGLAPSSGRPATSYAAQFFHGPMYPGAAVVHGHGVYFAEPGSTNSGHPNFPRLSEVALRYATRRGPSGVILRAALKPDARTLDAEKLREYYREDRNRARGVGITDFGTYAASIGTDAFWVDEHFTYCKERVWIVVNRRAVVFQNRLLRVS